MRYSMLALLFCSIMLCGCVQRLGDLTFLSTKNVDLSRLSDLKRSGQRVEGTDKQSLVIIIPTSGPANLEEAADRAIESVPGGVALVDAVMSSFAWYIPYIYGESGFTVEGEVLVDPQIVKMIYLDTVPAPERSRLDTEAKRTPTKNMVAPQGTGQEVTKEISPAKQRLLDAAGRR